MKQETDAVNTNKSGTRGRGGRVGSEEPRVEDKDGEDEFGVVASEVKGRVIMEAKALPEPEQRVQVHGDREESLRGDWLWR